MGGSAPPACGVGLSLAPILDARTGVVLFDSSCDPARTGVFGTQMFAMRPDGTGLRQLTAYRGMTVEPDGTVDVELPGPASYSGRRF